MLSSIEIALQIAVSLGARLGIVGWSYRHKEATHTTETHHDLSADISPEFGPACVLSVHLFWLGFQIQKNNFDFILIIEFVDVLWVIFNLNIS